MNNKKSLLSVLILVLVMIFFSCEKSEIPEDPLLLIPSDSSLLFQIKLKDILNTEAVKKLREKGAIPTKAINEIKERLNIDPFQDVESAIFALWSVNPPNGILLIKGNFNEQKIIETLKKENVNMKEEKYKYFTIYSIAEDKNPFAFSFLNWHNILVSKNPINVKKSIDTTFVKKKERKNIYDNETMKKLMLKLDFTSQIYGAADLKPLLSAYPVFAQSEFLNAIFALKIDPNNLISKITIDFTGPTKAQDFKTAFDQSLSQLGSNPATYQFYPIVANSIKSTLAGNSVIVDINLTKDNLDQLAEISKSISPTVTPGAPTPSTPTPPAPTGNN